MRTQIMYIENKQDLTGEAHIGLVQFSKSGKSIYYKGKTYQTLRGRGFKSNYFDVETGEEFWISGCHKNGEDRLYGERLPIYIDDDVREEYWTNIRNLPENKSVKVINGK